MKHLRIPVLVCLCAALSASCGDDSDGGSPCTVSGFMDCNVIAVEQCEGDDSVWWICGDGGNTYECPTMSCYDFCEGRLGPGVCTPSHDRWIPACPCE